MTGPPLIVATTGLSLASTDGRLRRLIHWLTACGVGVDVLVFGTGAHVGPLAQVAPITLVNELPGRATLLVGAAGGSRLNQAVRGRALRSWLAARPDSPVLVDQPEAASVLRYSTGPRRFVATLPSIGRLADLQATDRATLAGAAGWLVSRPAQVDEVRRQLGADAVEQGIVAVPEELPAAGHDEAGPVVLLPTPDHWRSVNHTIEVAGGLRRSEPERAVHWLGSGGEDDWLDGHDLRHAALADGVTLVDPDGPDVLDGVAALVRTGYGPSTSLLVSAARLGGVPVVGFDGQDVSSALPATPPFDVEGLVTSISQLLEPGAAHRLGIRPGELAGPDPAGVVDQIMAWLGLDTPRP